MGNEETPSIFDKIESRNYDSSCCFLCGEDFDRDSSTSEHVIPNWLQKKYNLHNQTMVLLNYTSIQYKYLKIPCCKKCNNMYLSKIEDEVKNKLNGGFKSFKSINREILFYWLGKIYYGILYRELFLLKDRADPDKGSIITPEFIDQLKAHHIFLQGIRKKHRFRDFFPASIFIFETQKTQEVDLQWDFMDNIKTMLIAIRMSDVGVIGVLQDGGTQESYLEPLSDFYQVPLHPIQFAEVVAIIAYRSLLFNRIPKYVSLNGGDIVETIQLSLQRLSSKPIFDEWNSSEYAQVLAFYTGLSVEEVSPISGKVMTWMKDDKGKVNYIDINKHPFG
jgi:hypothetical protein